MLAWFKGGPLDGEAIEIGQMPNELHVADHAVIVGIGPRDVEHREGDEGRYVCDSGESFQLAAKMAQIGVGEDGQPEHQGDTWAPIVIYSRGITYTWYPGPIDVPVDAADAA